MNAQDDEVELPIRTPGIGCPPWCDPGQCTNDAVREGQLWHHGKPHTVHGFRDTEPTPLTVQGTWVEKPEVHRGNENPAFEQPLVSVWELALDLTPAQARRVRRRARRCR